MELSLDNNTLHKPKHIIIYNQNMMYIAKLFAGRLNRKNFVLRIIAVELLFVLYLSLKHLIVAEDMSVLVWIIVFGLMIITKTSLVAKRLHDVGKSGWWALLVGPLTFEPYPESYFLLSTILYVIMLFGFLYLLIALGEGKNKYGNPPKNKIF